MFLLLPLLWVICMQFFPECFFKSSVHFTYGVALILLRLLGLPSRILLFYLSCHPNMSTTNFHLSSAICNETSLCEWCFITVLYLIHSFLWASNIYGSIPLCVFTTLSIFCVSLHIILETSMLESRMYAQVVYVDWMLLRNCWYFLFIELKYSSSFDIHFWRFVI